MYFENWPQKLQRQALPSYGLNKKFRSGFFDSIKPLSIPQPNYETGYDHNLYDPKFSEFEAQSAYQQVPEFEDHNLPTMPDQNFKPELEPPEKIDFDKEEIQNAIGRVSGNLHAPLFPGPEIQRPDIQAPVMAQPDFFNGFVEPCNNQFWSVPGLINPIGGM